MNMSFNGLLWVTTLPSKWTQPLKHTQGVEAERQLRARVLRLQQLRRCNFYLLSKNLLQMWFSRLLCLSLQVVTPFHHQHANSFLRCGVTLLAAAPLFKTLEKRRGEHAAALKEEEGGRKGGCFLGSFAMGYVWGLCIRCVALGHCRVAGVWEALRTWKRSLHWAQVAQMNHEIL